tara:strand:- start:1134 stop:1811 length:678 start_codon:yes stop_codon:yes gene_type:complete
LVDHIVIEPLSILWWKGLLSSFFSVVLLLFLLRKQSLKIKEIFQKALAFAFILVYLITLITTLRNGTWNIQDHLPLHLCRISFIICFITLLSKTQWMYEWCLFLAIPAGFHSLLTPELTNGTSNWFFFDYYFVHAGMLLAPLYLTLIMEMRPRKRAWLHTFYRLQIPVVFIFPLNFIINSNYMYLKAKPIVENPLLIGQWPYYILVLELVTLLHIYIIHLVILKR